VIILSTPITLPAPCNEVLANATVGNARIDNLNQKITLEFVACNGTNGNVAPSRNLPGYTLVVYLATGATYFKGSLTGWVQGADLANLVSAVVAFTRASEALALGLNLYPPGPNAIAPPAIAAQAASSTVTVPPNAVTIPPSAAAVPGTAPVQIFPGVIE
jgi:hypothetical protein